MPRISIIGRRRNRVRRAVTGILPLGLPFPSPGDPGYDSPLRPVSGSVRSGKGFVQRDGIDIPPPGLRLQRRQLGLVPDSFPNEA